MLRAMAHVKSSMVTASALRRVARIAASFTKLARSAPLKPAVSAAICSDGINVLAAVRQRLLEFAADIFIRNPNFGDLVVLQKALELAVRNGLNLPALKPPLLEEHESKQG